MSENKCNCAPGDNVFGSGCKEHDKPGSLYDQFKAKHPDLLEAHEEIVELGEQNAELRASARHVVEVFKRHRGCNQLPQELYDALNELSADLERSE